MSKSEITELMRNYLRERDFSGMTLEVVEKGVRQDGDWWLVPVRPTEYLPKTYYYYDQLVNLEDELREKENVEVLLVPS
jgi:hypothetical protein